MLGLRLRLKSESEVEKTSYGTVNKKQTRIKNCKQLTVIQNLRSTKNITKMLVAISSDGFLVYSFKFRPVI